MIFKCKMCGGSLEILDNESVSECEYCGTKQTIPRLDSEKKVNLYDRANHFRRNHEYDKAMEIYEQILNEDSTDAESYWSLVLCKYGIEYVEDPSSHKRIPTVNRTQYTSIYNDDNYKMALNCADTLQKIIYEEEAKYINDIQKEILEISQKETPFDIFICYKESDESGRRTRDSVIANDLYHQLTQEGFKVFFSRITLEDKIGTAYEPYIFAALNSAKAMIVLGTKSDYFTSPWVKNEWSRYLALINQGQQKMLVPAYRDMDPYDLPEEFSHLQALDMGKLGFIQDLIRGLKKLLIKEEVQKDSGREMPVSALNGPYIHGVEKLIKNADTYLKLDNYDVARDTYIRITTDFPEMYNGWWGLIICETKNFSKTIEEQSQLNTWFCYVRKLASPEVFKTLEDEYVKYTRMVAEKIAEHDVNIVQSKCNSYSKEIEENQNKINSLMSNLKHLETRYENEMEDLEYKVESCARVMGSISRKLGTRNWGCGLSVVLLLSSFVIAFTSLSWGITTMVVAIILISIFGDKNAKMKLGQKYDLNKKNYEVYANQLEGDKRLLQSKQLNIKSQIGALKKKISDNEVNIQSCKNYLNYDIEKLEEYWFARRCKDFGFSVPYDESIQEIRDKIN